MVEITLFTDTVKCSACHEVDMYNGLKKKNDRWYCKKCLTTQDAVHVHHGHNQQM